MSKGQWHLGFVVIRVALFAVRVVAIGVSCITSGVGMPCHTTALGFDASANVTRP